MNSLLLGILKRNTQKGSGASWGDEQFSSWWCISSDVFGFRYVTVCEIWLICFFCGCALFKEITSSGEGKASILLSRRKGKCMFCTLSFAVLLSLRSVVSFLVFNYSRMILF